jgi:hypothetical protein
MLRTQRGIQTSVRQVWETLGKSGRRWKYKFNVYFTELLAGSVCVSNWAQLPHFLISTMNHVLWWVFHWMSTNFEGILLVFLNCDNSFSHRQHWFPSAPISVLKNNSPWNPASVVAWYHLALITSTLKIRTTHFSKTLVSTLKATYVSEEYGASFFMVEKQTNKKRAPLSTRFIVVPSLAFSSKLKPELTCSS